MRSRNARRVALALAAAVLVSCGGDGGGGGVSSCDLAAFSVDVPDGICDLTDSLSVSLSAYNYGPDDCPSYIATFYLSSDIFIGNSGDTIIGTQSRTDGLAPSATDTYSSPVSWTAAAPGVYYVGVVLTCADDWNASNNAAYDPTPVTLSPGGVAADLYDEGDASNDFSPTTVSPGESWSAWCDVRNGGDGDAGPFNVRFYASLDETITTSDYLVGSVAVSSGVSAGSLVDADLSLPSFPSMPGGTYYVGWIIDAGDDVLESDETNNTAYEAGYTLTVIVLSGCDLTVLSVDAPDGTYGTTAWLTVGNSTYNYGPDACSGYSVAFYLSTDTTITAADTPIGSYSRPGGLAADGTDSDSNQVSWGGMAPGDYYVGMIVTCGDDSNPFNNAACDPTPITLSASAALFSDDFEDGDYAGWTDGGGTYTREVTSLTAAGGSTYSFTLTGGSSTHGDGISHALADLTPSQINFYVRSASTTVHDGFFVVGTGIDTTQQAVYFRTSDDGTMFVYDGSTYYSVPYVANQWYLISFVFNWGARQIDFYVDGSLVDTGIPFRGPSVDRLSAVYLYNWANSQAWWDEIECLP